MLSAITINKIGTLLLLYLVQGIPYGFQARFLPIYLRTQGVSLTNLGFFKILLIPWALKVLWAPLVDTHGSKRIWLLSSLGALALTCIMATWISPDQTVSLCIIVFCLNLFASTQDIAVDGIAIQILTQEELGAGNTVQVVGYKVGAIFGGGVMVWLIEYTGWNGMFMILAVFYAVTLVAAAQIGELHVTPKNTKSDSSITKSELKLELESSRLSTADEGEKRTYKSHMYQLRSSTKPEKKSLQNDQYNDGVQTETNQTDADMHTMDKNSLGLNHKYDKLSDSLKADNTHEFELRNRTKYGIKHGEEGREFEMCCDACGAIGGSGACSCEARRVVESRSIYLPQWIENALSTPYTIWTICYVILYKLGEQGAVGMFPLFLVDHGVSANEVTTWTGVIGQGLSIAGSLFGGWLLSKRFQPLQVLPVLFGLRLIPIAMETVLIGLSGYSTAIPFYGLCIGSMCLLQLIGGAITTATFTLMMQCSQGAPDHIQATHYTGLSTLEVMGKLSFMSFIGLATDMMGYFVVFCGFIGLSLTVFPLLNKRQ